MAAHRMHLRNNSYVKTCIGKLYCGSHSGKPRAYDYHVMDYHALTSKKKEALAKAQKTARCNKSPSL
jgi:hypothetical protein